jgi:UDP-N-acetylmuramoyl-tripeptide--D-alanyl-D-alanine ligase
MIAASAQRVGMRKDNILEYEEPEPIVEWLENNLSAKDAVLIKGSHGLRMDRIVSSLELPR